MDSSACSNHTARNWTRLSANGSFAAARRAFSKRSRPVWNVVPPRDYDKAELDKLLAALRQRLTLTPL